MKILFKVVLHNSKFIPTGKVIHNDGTGILPTPYALNISQCNGDDGFYLFYLDENGNEPTDTYHISLHDAFEQAEFEFGVKSSDWIKIN